MTSHWLLSVGGVLTLAISVGALVLASVPETAKAKPPEPNREPQPAAPAPTTCFMFDPTSHVQAPADPSQVPTLTRANFDPVDCPNWAWFGTCLSNSQHPQAMPCPVGLPGPTVTDPNAKACWRKGPGGFVVTKCPNWAAAGTCLNSKLNVVNNDPACPTTGGAGGSSGGESGGGGKPSPGGSSGTGGGNDNPLGATPNPNGAGRPDLREFLAAIGSLQAGLLPVLGGLSGVGVLIGAGLLALGQQAGVRLAAVSASSGGVVMLGYGLIAIFTPHG